MFYGIILACSLMNPTECVFLNSTSTFNTEEECTESFEYLPIPGGIYIAGRVCLSVEFLDSPL